MTIKGIYRRIRNCFFPKGHNEIVKKIAKLQKAVLLLQEQHDSYSLGFIPSDDTYYKHLKVERTLNYCKDQLSLLKKQYKQYYCK